MVHLFNILYHARLLDVYVKTSEPVKNMIRKHAQKLVDIIGLNGLLETFQNFPDGSQDLVLRMLIVYTNNIGGMSLLNIFIFHVYVFIF